MEPGILLASGGLDSTVLAYQLAEQDALREMFFVNYGQASAAHQALLVERHATALQVPFYEQKIDWPRFARGTGRMFRKGTFSTDVGPDETVKLGAAEYRRWLKANFDFLPGRNTAFILYALMRLVSVYPTATTLYLGYQYNAPVWSLGNPDERTDTSRGFVEAFNRLIQAGAFLEDVTLRAPFFEGQVDKREIVREAQRFGLRFEDTYSCEYYPVCGACYACKGRDRAERLARRPAGG